MKARTAQAGFTIIEIALGSAIAALLFLLFGQSFSTSSQMGATAHVDLMAHDTGRRSVDAVANVLRGAFWDAVELDDAGPSTVVRFQRVVDVDAAGAAVLGPVERLEWRATPAVDGILNPGALVHVKAAGETVIAPRVPQGGFHAQLSGMLLRVQVTTWHGQQATRTKLVTLDGAVALRN